MNTINNVLSVFDGMSCGQIALNNLGIKYENYFSSEIDKHAIKVTQHNYPDTIQLGDITKVKAKLLCLSEVYSYICSYDSNLQSNIREWEVLYWLDKNFTFSAKIGTQEPNEGQKVSKSSSIQRIEEVWFSNREMGSVRKFGDDTRSGSNGKENDIRTPQQLQCSEWRYDNDIYRRYKEENIGIAIRETKNGDSEKKNFGNIEETVFKGKESENYFGENKKSNVEEGCSGELLEREGEDRFSRTVKKEKRNGRAEKNSFIDEIVRELCGWNETDGIAQDYWNILRLHKEEQVTVVEYEGGYHIFKGKIDLLCGGSPCQGFSFAGKGLNFEDPRSKLFFEFTRLLKECNPKFFLLENVKMKQEYQDIISEQLGVNPILINSSLVSAQNRERLYWTNIQNVVSPTDRHIYIKDILQPELDIDYIDNFKNCVRKNMIGIEISKYVKNSGFAQIPVKSGFQDHKVGITKSPCLRAGNPFCLVETKSGGIRRLTPLECERLQNVPENYTDIVADTHRYSMLGNGWTVGVIEHIFKNICS